MGILSNLLAHPLTANLLVDDPRTTLLRREIINSKLFLRAIYSKWYKQIIELLPIRNGNILELGSGAGFLAQLLPNVITSEIFEMPGVDLIADACKLPLSNNSLDAIIMTDVFHHIPDVSQFLQEATRCIGPKGKIVMVEPWFTPWSKFIYTRLHSEPFYTEGDWKIPNTGPLSGANGALPWIVFQRDKNIFEANFPQWRIKKIEPMMPFSYLLSGGVSMRSLMPGWAFKTVVNLENLLRQDRFAMFALIELEKI